jgi:hypothetical protein
MFSPIEWKVPGVTLQHAEHEFIFDPHTHCLVA